MKRIIGLSIIILLICTSGCVVKPQPKNPKGPNITLARAINDTDTYIAKKTIENTYEFKPIATDECSGFPCSWSGPNMGNCTKWAFYYEGVTKNDSGYAHNTIYIITQYTTKGVNPVIRSIHSNTITNASVSATISDIQNRSLIKYLHFDSRDIFLISKDANKWNSTGYYLYYIILYYYINMTDSNNTPLWWVRWEYRQNKEPYSSTMFEVYINGINGTIYKTHYPRG
jgi:hypothetical protein